MFTKINNLLSELTNKGEESKQYQNQYDQQLTGLRKIEADIEDQRVIDSQANQKYNDFQQQHFELQSKIARLEQSIEYEKELESQKNVNVQEINKELKRIESEYYLKYVKRRADKDTKRTNWPFRCENKC